MTYTNYQNLIKSICKLKGFEYKFQFDSDRYKVNYSTNTIYLPKKVSTEKQFVKSLYTIGLIMHGKNGKERNHKELVI